VPARIAALLLVLSAACVSRAPPALPSYVKRTREPPFRPPEPDAKNWDWVELTSDEWLKGEFKYMRDHTLEIDSDELDDLKFSWRKVKVFRSPRRMTVLLENQATISGAVAVQENEVVVKDGEEFVVFPRRNLVTIVPAGEGALAFWSGKLSLGFAASTGNTDQVDTSLAFSLRRRAPRSRFLLDYLGSFSRVNGEDTVDNQRLAGRYDLFLARRWYATPLAADVYRDPFQNIAVRVTPMAGAGYYLFKKDYDQGVVDWDVSVLGGYRFTEFDSGASSEGTFNVAFTTGVEWDVTEKLDLELHYDLQLGLPDVEDTNQNLTLKLSWDVWKDLDFDFTFVWNFVGQPRADADGVVPEKNDLRFIFGVGWDF